MAKQAMQSKKKNVTVERISPGEEYNLPVFRERLRSILKKRGLTQLALAQHLHRDPRQINLTVIGTYKPDLKMLKGIAEYLNISLDWLFDVGRRPWFDEETKPDATLPLMLNGDPNMIVSLPKAMVQRTFGTNLDNIHLVSVDTDDMAPTFQHGDLSFLKKTGFQHRSGVYMLRSDKINVIRRVNYDAISNKVTVSMDARPEDAHQMTLNKLSVVGQIFRLSYAS